MRPFLKQDAIPQNELTRRQWSLIWALLEPLRNETHFSFEASRLIEPARVGLTLPLGLRVLNDVKVGCRQFGLRDQSGKLDLRSLPGAVGIIEEFSRRFVVDDPVRNILRLGSEAEP